MTNVTYYPDASTYIRQWSYLLAWLDRREPRLVKTLRAEGFTDSQIVRVLRALDCTCNYCWDSHPRCQCWNDG